MTKYNRILAWIRSKSEHGDPQPRTSGEQGPTARDRNRYREALQEIMRVSTCAQAIAIAREALPHGWHPK